jgi:CRP/FNR family cyclic AMP-dependent transcriptional regulator
MAKRFDRDTLRRVRILSSLTDAELDALAASLRERMLGAGEALCRQGDYGDTMVVVFSGKLDARVQQADGVEVSLTEAGPGEVLGEMACIDPAPRAATLVALEPTRVGELSRDALTALRTGAPGAYSAILGAVIHDVTRRLRDVERRVAEVTASTPKESAPRAEERSGFWRFIDRLRGLT